MKAKHSPKNRNLLGCFVAAAGIFLVCLFVGVAWFYNSVVAPLREMSSSEQIPAELREPRIVRAADFVEKNEIFKQKESGFLEMVVKSFVIKNEREHEMMKNSEIAKITHGFDDITFNPATGEIVLAGRFGAQFLDRNGNLRREVLFEPTAEKFKFWGFEQTRYRQDFDNYRIVDLESDGKKEFLAYGGLDGIAVFDEQGSALWRFGQFNLPLSEVFNEEKWNVARKENPNISGAAVGDLDGDSAAEIIFTRRDNQIYAFKKDGSQLWREPSEVPGDELWTFDLDGDKKAEIVEIFFSKPIIRDFRGKTVKTLELDWVSCQDVLLTDERKLHFVGVTENKLRISDEDNNEILTAEAPFSEVPRKLTVQSHTPIRINDQIIVAPVDDDRKTEKIHNSKALRVNLRAGEPKYLAVIAPYILFDRTMFYIYDASGKLVYDEILPENAEAITVLPNEKGAEAILIAGKTTVWRYNAK